MTSHTLWWLFQALMCLYILVLGMKYENDRCILLYDSCLVSTPRALM